MQQCFLGRSVVTTARRLTKSRPYVISCASSTFSPSMSSNRSGKKGAVKAVSPSRARSSGSWPDSNQNAGAGQTSRDGGGKLVPHKDRTTADGKETSPRFYATRHNFHKQEIQQRRADYLAMSLESKRKLYKSKYVTLDEIQTWPDYFIKEVRLSSEEKAAPEKDEREDLNQKISVFKGDITTLEIDAIVNAANESLLGGGGVDGAIHRAAGPHLRSECETLNGCEPGDAKITCGYDLPARYVIHTVGPRGENPRVLKNCYTRCLELVKEHKLSSVAFPCISTGIFGYPNGNAARVALNTIREWLDTNDNAKHVERIIFCLFLKVDVTAYEKLLPIYFPVSCPADEFVDRSSCCENEESSGLQRESLKSKSKIETEKE